MVETRLHVHDAKLPVYLFSVRGHGPKESDRVPWDGDIGMVSTWHEHRIPVPDWNHQFRVLGIVVHKL